MLAMIGLQILVTKGSQLGFTSVIGIVLIAATLLFFIYILLH
jgi:hypothetical protein